MLDLLKAFKYVHIFHYKTVSTEVSEREKSEFLGSVLSGH